MRKTLVLTAVAVLLVGICPAAEHEIHTVTPARVAVCTQVDGEIELDGVLDDAPWEHGITFSGFTFSAPGMQMPYNQTSVTIVRDDAAIYFGVRCLEENMEGLVANETGLDANVWHDDDIEIFFDSHHTHREFLQFAANSLAAQFDGKTGVSTWDSDWDVAAHTDATGWNLEFRIPFEACGVSPSTGDIWGFNICRERQVGGETELHNWANVEGNFHRPWLFGHLYFAGTQFELTDQLADTLLHEIEVPVRIYLDDGPALVDENGIQTQTYRGLLAEALGRAGELTAMHSELEDSYSDQPDLPYREQFEDIDARYTQLREAADSEGKLSAVKWALHTVQVRRLKNLLDSFLWKVKLALLLREA